MAERFQQIKLGNTKEEVYLDKLFMNAIKYLERPRESTNSKEGYLQKFISGLEQYKKTIFTPQNQEPINAAIQAAKNMIEALYPERLQKLIEEERARQAAEEIQRKTTAEEQRKAAMEPARVEKLKKLVQVSKKLKVGQMAQILDLTEKELYDRIVDWASQFGFTLDEDVVEFGVGRKDDFIASLDKEFANWGKTGTSGKV